MPVHKNPAAASTTTNPTIHAAAAMPRTIQSSTIMGNRLQQSVSHPYALQRPGRRGGDDVAVHFRVLNVERVGLDARFDAAFVLRRPVRCGREDRAAIAVVDEKCARAEVADDVTAVHHITPTITIVCNSEVSATAMPTAAMSR